MPGDPGVIDYLNQQLTGGLTAINQSFLHATMQANDGSVKLAAHSRAESIEEMRHAEILTDPILLLEGLPNYHRLSPLRIGQTVREQFHNDLQVEIDAVDILKPGIEHMRSVGDSTSRRLFDDILADEEEHSDYLETQLALIDKVGEQLYLSVLLQLPSD